jgi:sortase A
MDPHDPQQMPKQPDESRGYLHPSARRESTIAPLSHSQPESVATEQPAKAEPIKTDNDPYVQNPQAYDWQQYHAAWQQYYQQYYHRYYTQQVLTHQQQLQQQYADEAKPEAPAPIDHTVTGSDTIGESKSKFQQVRDDLLGKVREQADKFRRSSHFMPVLSALVVGSLFLALQYNRSVVAQIEAYISPGSTVDVSDTFIADPSANADVGAEPKLLIPKINVNVPVVYDVPTVDDKQVQAGLEKGVVRYNLSGANSLPGQTGNMVVLGHSSNDVFDPGAYKFTFVLLERLQPGDLFYMHYQGKRYVYKVAQKKIIKPTEWKILQENNGKPNVVLVTCTPTGTALNRLLVYGEQISPDPGTAVAKPSDAQETNPAEIPGNSPTFFERLGDILF